jgi:F1F0 ATPase subunit 2
MNDFALLVGVLLAGALIGTVFFGGLWLTVQKALTSDHPAWWFFGSTLLRTGFALAGFYFISQGDWRKILLSLLGFFAARVVISRLTVTPEKEVHAP